MSQMGCIHSLLVVLFVILSQIYAGYEPKATAEYHHTCGCNNRFYLNKLDGTPFGEGNPSSFSVSGTDASVAVVTSDLPGSTKCNEIKTYPDVFAYLEIDNDDVVCFMNNRYNWLSGYYFTQNDKYTTIKGEYKTDGDWIPMGVLSKKGMPFWNKFDYYIDFEGKTNVTGFRLLVSSPDFQTPVKIDQITICRYCDGTLTSAGPKLMKLESNGGTFNRTFDSDVPDYTLSFDQAARYFKLRPTIESGYASDPNVEITVNGSTVSSGSESPQIEVVNGGTVFIIVKRATCERTIYSVNIKVPVPEDKDARLLSLTVSEGELSPRFYSLTPQTTFTNTVPVGTSVLKLTPTANNKGATITVNGINVQSGQETGDIDISTSKTITIVVTAKDGVTTRTYMVTAVDKVEPVIYVDYDASCPGGCDGTSWSKAYRRIEDALAKAKSSPGVNWEIWIAAGNYTATSFFNIDFGIKIYGGFPADGGTWDTRNTDVNQVNLLGSGASQIVKVQTESPVVLDGLCIKQSAVNGLFLTNTKDVQIKNCKITQNAGTGIEALQNYILLIDGCQITRNSNGGLTVNDCEKNLIIKDCLIEKCTSNNAGGGLFVTTTGTVRMVNCQILNNIGKNGGGLFIDGYNACLDFQIANSLFAGNKAVRYSSGDGYGGGIYSAAKKLRVMNCTFAENIADLTGGGLYYQDVGLRSGMDHYILNSIFWNNKIPGYSPPATPLSDISQLSAASTNAVPVNFSCIQDIAENNGTVYPSPASETNKNFDLNPEFLTDGSWNTGFSTWTSGEYVLTNLSSCLEKGDLKVDLLRDQVDLDDDGDIAEVLPIDLSGNPRVVDSDKDGVKNIDVGCYEYSTLDPPPVVSIVLPTAELSYWTSSSTINISGTATDNSAVNSVSYVVTGATTGSGNATGTNSWSISNLILNPGITTITISAIDDDGNTGRKKITIIYEINTSIRFVRADIKDNGTDIPGVPGQPGAGCSWNTAYQHLQDALAEARITGSGITEIRVAEGIYYPDETYSNPSGTDLRSSSFELIAGVTLKGGYLDDGSGNRNPNLFTNPNEIKTILNGNIDHEDGNNDLDGNSLHVVRGANCVLDGFTIRSGCADVYLADDMGGGLITTSVSQTVINCRFTENFAYSYGCGMYIFGGNATIQNSTFQNNSAINTGYSVGGGICLENSNVTIESSNFSSNMLFNDDGTIPAKSGGAIAILGGTLNVTGSIFASNKVNTGGAAIHAETGVVQALSNCTFENNESVYSGEGGAINISGGVSESNINKCKFSDNNARFGAAIFYKYCSGMHTVKNSIFLRNEASENGGAIYTSWVTGLEIENSTFSMNYAPAGIGGAIHNFATTTTIINCIFWYNDAVLPGYKDLYHYSAGGTKSLLVSYSDIQQSGFSGNNNKSVDPLFCCYPDQPSTYQDLKIQGTSQCKDAGDNANFPVDDIEGNIRTIPDIGAYEYTIPCN